MPVESNDFQKELEAQKEILLKIYEQTQKTRRYILFGRILSVVYLILVIAPIIFAIFYLPPLFKQVVEPYKELLGQDNGLPSDNADLMNNLLNQLKK
ncbi:hypothetical protein CO134_02235 [Candidatus Kuenenbacteria bacterium CG_4_9_14_3_um_filter_39_14]|uniref:Uncharacterized protein n=6 Tax=Candidatus Kueneniibacteriota TaxID=1752740 RepID=A0A2M7IM12_9BACT|nr:hypothetical protein [Candidatus Kuenenbacteria bacterium]OIP56571.1 MAG: hypothetical protein AUK13_00850 [Candidatus Kuenenbacteria bacterium CG2_30_39_24]PIP75443.1 MAG: hypothetical protein COW86_03765 [Candidatus Kuenenbacteria bacterium CG22_combo_CG10-13_8_21_14_all_39_9]PIR81158.1 MAG: hypothetical protein COU24_00240 [Candidatus Kuenenbacteria bacterium CG10_big_fil_rev_8_21_14_0_10_39_14]PIW95872.1 MAG: hypothetical protein COZ84_01150 [Candidatus Kuenenbacteria bacterium CG_4_8_14